MKYWAFLIAGMLISQASYAGPCEEARSNYWISGTSRASLTMQGKDGRYFPLEIRLRCKGVNGEAQEAATVTGAQQLIQSFTKSGELQKVEVHSSGDEMSGEVEPKVRLSIAENATTPEMQRRYLVAIQWSERAPDDDLYGKSFLYVNANYTEYRLDSNQKWTAVPNKTRVPLQIRQDLSFAIFEGKKLSLTTNPLVQQGQEDRYIQKTAKQYGEGISDGTSSVSGCDLREVSMGKFEGSCTGDYEFLVHGGHRVRGHFTCDFQLEHKSGVTEVIREDCGKGL
jgi:hypothetical protein